jgi:hypothetical protein
MPFAEGVEERVGDDVICHPIAQPAGDVAVQEGGMPVREMRLPCCRGAERVFLGPSCTGTVRRMTANPDGPKALARL